MTPASHPSPLPIAGFHRWLRVALLLGVFPLGCAILSSPKGLAEPLDAAGYAERCSQLTREKEWQAAVADCSKAIRLDPAQVEAWLDRCWARVEVGEADKAVADCLEGLRLDPVNSRGYVIQGYMKSEGLKDYHGALADFNKGLP